MRHRSTKGDGVSFGLGWVRRRQRSLARGVLALFCAAWLQAAVVPCVMAHEAALAVTVDGAVQHQHSSGVGHDHGDVAAALDSTGPSHDCLYCPPDETGSAPCDEQSGCTYPHGPQVDARAGAIYVALPAAFVVPAPAPLRFAAGIAPAVPEFVPRVRLSVSYCRFLE